MRTLRLVVPELEATALRATTVNRYFLPRFRPFTTHEVPEVRHLRLPGEAETVYLATRDPPLNAGLAHFTLALPWPTFTFTLRGPDGEPIGTTAADHADDKLDPPGLCAVTANCTGVPFASPVTKQDVPVAAHPGRPVEVITV